jgi:hypothetical protein
MNVFKANKVWRFKRSHLFAPPFWVGVAVAVTSTSGAGADELWTSKSLDQQAEIVLIAQANPSTQSQPQRTAQPTTSTPQGAGTSASPPRSAQAASNQVSKLALAVAQLGVLRCVERADQVSKFLSPTGSETLIVDSLPGNASGDMVTATLFVPVEGGEASTVEVSLFPAANGCNARYSAISHVAAKCSVAESKNFPGLVFNLLGSGPYRLVGIGNSGRVLSQDLSDGCLFLKHEVIR